MFEFSCRFVEGEDEFFNDAKALDSNYTVNKGADNGFDVITIRTSNLNGLISFVKEWYDCSGEFGDKNITNLAERYGIEKVA